MKVAIVLAREGSKRILKKNIKEFCGKPIISWTISKLKESNLFNKIIVSTDSKEIASVAIKCGAEVPFMRPKNLSDDYASTLDVMHHATQWLMDQKIDAQIISCSYATSVFLKTNLLDEGIRMVQDHNWKASMSVVESNSSVFRSFYASKSDGLEMVFPNEFKKRSQDLTKTYHDAAQFYVAGPDFWLEKKVFYSAKTFPIEHPSSSLVDIDSLEDWRLAEAIFKTYHMA